MDIPKNYCVYDNLEASQKSIDTYARCKRSMEFLNRYDKSCAGIRYGMCTLQEWTSYQHAIDALGFTSRDFQRWNQEALEARKLDEIYGPVGAQLNFFRLYKQK